MEADGAGAADAAGAGELEVAGVLVDAELVDASLGYIPVSHVHVSEPFLQKK